MLNGILVHQSDDPDQIDSWAQVVAQQVAALVSASANALLDPDMQYEADFWVNLTNGAYPIQPQVLWDYDDNADSFSRPGILISPNVDDSSAADRWISVSDALVTGVLVMSTDDIQTYPLLHNQDYWVNITVGGQAEPNPGYIYDVDANTFALPPDTGLADLRAAFVAVHDAMVAAKNVSISVPYEYNRSMAVSLAQSDLYPVAFDATDWELILELAAWLDPAP